jgi:hypothetical protein
VDGANRTVVRAETLRREQVEVEVEGRPGENITVVLDLPGWSDDLLIVPPNGGRIIGVTDCGDFTPTRML